MAEARAEHLILTGGGESYANLPAMAMMLRGIPNLRQVVTVTSGYFADSADAASETLRFLKEGIRVGNLLHERTRVDFILRLSFDTFHRVPPASIVHAVRAAMSLNDDDVRFRPIIRTILDPAENLDRVLARDLGADLFPPKDPLDPVRGLPIIDGFPTRWLCTKEWEIPVIYKPVYFEGMAQNRRHVSIPGTSWMEIKAFEEEHGSIFNLSLRGSHGEGHNYYETVLRGHSHWQNQLSGVSRYNSLKRQDTKGLCVYVPADGRFFINASSPDSYMPIDSVVSWKIYRDVVIRDILQGTAVSRPTDDLVGLASEVRPKIREELDRRNFVFSAAHLAMETASLRLYLTIRLLQRETQAGFLFSDPLVNRLLSLNIEDLKAAFNAGSLALGLFVPAEDPIVGSEESVWATDERSSRLSMEIGALLASSRQSV